MRNLCATYARIHPFIPMMMMIIIISSSIAITIIITIIININITTITNIIIATAGARFMTCQQSTIALSRNASNVNV